MDLNEAKQILKKNGYICEEWSGADEAYEKYGKEGSHNYRKWDMDDHYDKVLDEGLNMLTAEYIGNEGLNIDEDSPLFQTLKFKIKKYLASKWGDSSYKG